MAKQGAAEYLEKRSPEVSVILAELAESAGAVARSWHLAVEFARQHPDRAERHLIDAEIRLNHHVRLELTDSLRRIRRGIELFARELPDQE